MKYPRSLPWISILIKRQYSSKSFKNHYDSLKITPKATQNEVKSAYFQLSKLYHPDKNDSDDAKEKFRNISEAYEVLGNHEKRKQYDRHLHITTPTSKTVSDYPIFRDLSRNMSSEELKKEAERVKTEFSRHGGGFATYDMETWTKEHYGRIFQETMEKKYRQEARKKAKEKAIKDAKDLQNAEFLHFIVMVILIIGFAILHFYFMRPSEIPHVKNFDKTKNEK
ncbi:dnaJ homolog subfamily B member 9-like [Chelonus insularis]|uniref:dnaJ homolog subfamily B member 9-like n=1 Tax=Chelonus insularis TaxID=460826 RepID=UPI0015885E12|nr:dnaJ homolog subfamily B member 9-like [Chelonus insularis]